MTSSKRETVLFWFSEKKGLDNVDMGWRDKCIFFIKKWRDKCIFVPGLCFVFSLSFLQ